MEKKQLAPPSHPLSDVQNASLFDVKTALKSFDLSHFPKVIALCSLKGGAGKTMVSGHLALALSRQQIPVVVIDCDNEGGMLGVAREAQAAGSPLPFEVEIGARDAFKRRAKALAAEGYTVILDTPGNSRELATGAASVADITLVPVGPSEYDLDRLGALLEMFDDLAVVHDFDFRVLLNRYEKSKVLSRQLDETLQRLPRLEQMIPESEFYKRFVSNETREQSLRPFYGLMLELAQLREVQA